MKSNLSRYARSQGGYTLIELLVSLSIGLIVMTALTSVVLTSSRAWATAAGRVEASAQIRAFQFAAADDFGARCCRDGGRIVSAIVRHHQDTIRWVHLRLDVRQQSSVY